MFLLPYAKNTYYVPLMKALQIGNTQIGMMGSAFGVAAMLSYLPGGWLADRVSARKLLTLCLFLTGLGGFYLSVYPPYAICLFLHAIWGAASGAFLGSLVKAIRNLANTSQQGKAFGFYEAGRGVVNSVLMTIALAVFACLGSNVAGLAGVLRLYSSAAILLSLVTWRLLPDHQHPQHGGAVWPEIVKALRLPQVWLLALFTFCSYAPIVAILFIAPFTTVAYGGSIVLGASLSIAAQYVRPLASTSAGLLADRTSTSRVSLGGMILLSAALFGLALVPGNRRLIILLVFTCLACYLTMYIVYSMNYALLEEGNIPKNICGTAVGVIATLGYLPEILVPGLGGRLLDLVPGAPGYERLFTAIAILAVAGICVMLYWIRLTGSKSTGIPSRSAAP
jgi:predicted MFS family arabinose efflux permease